MINIVIPMAGLGSRFSKAGFELPKPLIPINGIPMIKVVIDNLKPAKDHKFIFICQKEHENKYNLTENLKKWAPNSIIIQIDGLTEGAACTVLESKQYINNDDELMIANSDQYIDFDIDKYLGYLENEKIDGLIMSMSANDPKWSFVEIKNNLVKRVVEKEVISNEATVGIYNFKRGSDFVYGAEKMINRNERVNNEFYVAPVYNQLINENKKIKIFNIGSEYKGMYGLGTPEDLEIFLTLEVSKKIR